ncbi:MAG: tetratricopeptide repeat protein, partial [Deltaproteobacteria bacterium]|nr:tetratricopeptide repeat protein [Deltaproteobacteria bacterium]
MDDRRRPLRLACAYALVALLAPVAHAAPPPPARPEPAPEAPAPTLAAVRAALDGWQLTSADALLARLKPAKAEATEAATLRAALELARSDHQAVIKRLTPIVRADPVAYEARVVLGRALYAVGRDVDALAVLDVMADDYNEDRVTSARDLGFLGVGLHLTGYFKNANRVFQEAIDKDPDDIAARIAWAELFLSKYNYRDADQLYREVLAKRPGDLRAKLGAARVAIASDSAYAEATKLLDEVIAAAPECAPAHTLLALIDLQNERPLEAIERLERQSLVIAPRDGEALALVAAAHYLLDDARAFAAAEKRALAVNPKHAGLYVTVAQHAERVHRYVEAQRLLDKALALDPESSDALSALGIAWSRLGNDQKASETLQQAHDADPYHVPTYNLLSSFYDRIDKDFVWLEAPPMRVRVDKREAPVLERFVPRLLDEAWRHFAKKYAFKPKLPVHVEIFPDVETFAVRSVGLPGLAAHGICFGHVVTARSPSAGDFNWAEVLWHELAHVYHLQLSGSRVPRWFTEGFAVYESLEGRTSWAREMDPELWRARKAGKLRGFGDFNLAFTQARTLDDILVAYYHATQVARFLDVTWGFP